MVKLSSRFPYLRLLMCFLLVPCLSMAQSGGGGNGGGNGGGGNGGGHGGGDHGGTHGGGKSPGVIEYVGMVNVSQTGAYETGYKLLVFQAAGHEYSITNPKSVDSHVGHNVVLSGLVRSNDTITVEHVVTCKTEKKTMN